MTELESKIRALTEALSYELDPIDLGITVTVAMTAKQVEDLEAMFDSLMAGSMNKIEVLYNILHDLGGLKAAYLNKQEAHYVDDCFVPRSSGYAAKV